MGISKCCCKRNFYELEDLASEIFLNKVLKQTFLINLTFEQIFKTFTKKELCDYKANNESKEAIFIPIYRFGEIVTKLFYTKDIMKNQFSLIHSYIFASLAVTNDSNDKEVNLNKFLCLILSFLKEDIKTKIHYFILMNDYIFQEEEIDSISGRGILIDYMNYIIIKLSSSFIFAIYNERIKYKTLLNSVNILGKKFDEKLIIHFTDFLILKDFRKNKMSQDDLSDILLRNAFFLDFFSLRGKFFEETN